MVTVAATEIKTFVECDQYIMYISKIDWIQAQKVNIAKGTTDLRVEFISQDHSSQFTNLEHMYYNFRISNKR